MYRGGVELDDEDVVEVEDVVLKLKLKLMAIMFMMKPIKYSESKE